MTKSTSSTWQPDVFGGAGKVREPGKDRADNMRRAGQEMRDTGSSDLFDYTDLSNGQPIPAGDPRTLSTKEARIAAAQAAQAAFDSCHRLCPRTPYFRGVLGQPPIPSKKSV